MNLNGGLTSEFDLEFRVEFDFEINGLLTGVGLDQDKIILISFMLSIMLI